MALNEIELALLDALKAVIDVQMAMNPAVTKALASHFEHQRDGKLRSG